MPASQFKTGHQPVETHMNTSPQWTKKDLLSHPIEHIDISGFDARPIIDAYRSMAFQSRNLAKATDIYDQMIADRDCAVILTLAGSLISAGLKEAIITMLESNMIDAIVATGANIVDQDFFEGLGFRHYIAPGSPEAPPVNDPTLRDMKIDRIYDTYIDEDQLRICDDTTKRIFDDMPAGSYSSRELIAAMGNYLEAHHPNARSLVLTARRKGVPIFVPAFSDCSAGFGIVLHQTERAATGQPFVAIDSGKDFRELTQLKLANPETGLLMLGGGVPKNFAQDIVVAAELLVGDDEAITMHKYAVQFTVADSRDGALSGSTLREACSWGKVDVVHEQMVYGEATTLFPLLASAVYHARRWEHRPERRFNDVLAQISVPAGS